MAAFIFKLQALLNLKKQLENNIKNELGKAIQKLEIEKEALQELESIMLALVDEFNIKCKKSTVQNLLKFNSYLTLITEKIKNQKENVNYAQQYSDKVREQLIEIIKEREIIDKLKEKQYESFIREQLKQEQRLNDEIISYKHKDNGSGEKKWLIRKI